MARSPLYVCVEWQGRKWLFLHYRHYSKRHDPRRRFAKNLKPTLKDTLRPTKGLPRTAKYAALFIRREIAPYFILELAGITRSHRRALSSRLDYTRNSQSVHLRYLLRARLRYRIVCTCDVQCDSSRVPLGKLVPLHSSGKEGGGAFTLMEKSVSGLSLLCPNVVLISLWSVKEISMAESILMEKTLDWSVFLYWYVFIF